MTKRLKRIGMLHRQFDQVYRQLEHIIDRMELLLVPPIAVIYPLLLNTMTIGRTNTNAIPKDRVFSILILKFDWKDKTTSGVKIFNMIHRRVESIS